MLTALFTVGATASYFGWHVVFELIAPWINPPTKTPQIMWDIVVGGMSFLFVVQTVLQTSPDGRVANWLQPHLLAGLYIDDWFTRMTFRLWPPGFHH